MKFNIVFSIIISVILFSCHENRLCIKGDGVIREYELTNLEDFDKVELTGPIDLKIIQSTTPSVTILAEQALMDVMEYRVKNDELQVGFERKINCLNNTKPVTVVVAVPDLVEIQIDGNSEITCEGTIDFNELTITSYGKSEVELEGSVNHQTFIAEGKMEVSNFNLQSKTTYIDVNGSGEFDIACSEVLDIDVNGKAEVNYIGQPSISQDVNGSLELKSVNR
ncbi:head GIN domain-containing protein [Echinicola sp. 20G]|uniref:head GIN domain-containing protein n=1 Tax=Echinicola sp. 20G TaxID=2781961 RepID=UPI0019109999|nr:head GIN domain-containing protein [Echinicola sp. 20G]